MASFSPLLQILPPAQRLLWNDLGSAVELGFVLYGGTAIALRLGHRVSVDFDFFTERPLQRQQLERKLPFLRKARVLQDSPDTFTVLAQSDAQNPATVKLSFFGQIGFGRVGEPEWTDDGRVQIASCDDLLATKLKVLLQRVEAKDYADVAELLKAGVSLESGLAGARALFGPSFQPSECLKALVYFEGGDLNTLSHETKGFLIRASSTVRNIPSREVVAQQLAIL